MIRRIRYYRYLRHDYGWSRRGAWKYAGQRARERRLRH